MVSALIAIPFLGVLSIVIWNIHAYFTLTEIFQFAAIGVFIIAFAVQAFVSYHELERSEHEGIGQVGFSIKQTVRQYLKAVLMPVIPHLSFIKQIKKVMTHDDD